VNQRRRVERPRPALAPQMASSQLLQFLVHERNDDAERLLVAGMDGPQRLIVCTVAEFYADRESACQRASGAPRTLRRGIGLLR